MVVRGLADADLLKKYVKLRKNTVIMAVQKRIL